jgi:hypothetical protein
MHTSESVEAGGEVAWCLFTGERWWAVPTLPGGQGRLAWVREESTDSDQYTPLGAGREVASGSC